MFLGYYKKMSETEGLRLFIYDDSSMDLLLTHSLPEDYNSLKDFVNHKYPYQKFGFCRLEDNLEIFNEICDHNSFAEALNNITGQGLSIKVKKSFKLEGPWRCIRCQYIEKNPNIFTCPICKLNRSS